MDDDDATDDDDASATDNDGDPDETDCDDEDPEVASTFDEVCGDGKDNDCDEETRCYSLRRGDDVHWIEPVRGTIRRGILWLRRRGKQRPRA